MKDGLYISVICMDNETTDVNFISLVARLPGINIVDGLPGNEILIRCNDNNGKPTYSLRQVREALERSARVDMFELVTDPKSGEQYRNWYYLTCRSIKRKKNKGKAA